MNKLYLIFAALACVSLMSCGGSGSKDYVETVVEEPTQGVIVDLKENEPNIFRILDEEVIDRREDSRIYVTFLDGLRDTFTLDEVTLTEYNDPKRSAIRSIAMGGMFGYMMGGMGRGLNRSAYASESAYKKSSTAGTSKLRSTAKRKVTKTPKAKSSGYGSRKSSRSYGG